MKNINSEKRKPDYSYVIISVTALMVCVVLGFCSSSKSLYLKAVTEALNISRSTFSINDSLRYISSAIISLFFGRLIACWGAKKLIGAGFTCLIASSLFYSFATDVVFIYVGGILLGIGLSWTTTTMVGYIVNIWHKENKGTITGGILATNGIGSAIATQILSPVIHNGVYGYRNAYLLVSAILLFVFVVIMIFFKDAPEKNVEHRQLKSNTKTRTDDWEGIEYSEAVKKTYFYGILFCIFVTGMVLQSISGIATPHLYDNGLAESYVATVVSCHALALTVFKFLVGVIYDKFGMRITSNICIFASIVSFVLLYSATDSVEGKVFAMVYAVVSAIALPLETIMLPLYANSLFGEKSFNKILGIFVSVNTAGYALGAPISNLCYDITGNYNVALYVSCILMVIVVICINRIITTASQQRKSIVRI